VQRRLCLPAIRHEADASEAEQQHGPGGRFGNAGYQHFTRREISVIRADFGVRGVNSGNDATRAVEGYGDDKL
jgi:hypothetical protein